MFGAQKKSLSSPSLCLRRMAFIFSSHGLVFFLAQRRLELLYTEQGSWCSRPRMVGVPYLRGTACLSASSCQDREELASGWK